VNSAGQVYQWIEATTSWKHIDTPFLKMISISSDNKIAGIDIQNNILFSNLDDLLSWHKIPGDFIYVDINNNNIVAT
jgi:hypothetical protein